MIIHNRFIAGNYYAIAGHIYTCVQVTTYGRKLSGVQQAVLANNGGRYIVTRWADGEINRLIKQRN